MRDRYLAFDPDNCTEDDAVVILAMTHEGAAEKYAERSDSRSAEYTYARNGGAVMVRLEGTDDPWRLFDVTGEAVPVYHARAAKGGAS